VASDAVLKVAVPLELSVAVPKGTDPFRNVTTPVGTVLPDCGVTCALRVTL
jgi:hypothetical protein